jgi:hypothetical protein
MSEHPHLDSLMEHGPIASQPHAGHEGTTYEGIDASVKMVIFSLVIIALILVVTFAITVPIFRTLRDTNPPGNLPSPLAPARVIPPAPNLEVHPWDTYPDLLAEQEKTLHSSGRDANGHIHISIEQAQNAVLPTLNVRANAPPGLTVPGGQGRDFAGSLASMPPAYQSPTIQGEIHKNAQPQAPR